MMVPSLVTTPTRSPSPSKARPRSASGLLDLGDQVLQVLRLARVRVVVGEGAVDLAVQRDHAAAQGLDQLRGDHAGHAVAAVDHHLQRLGQGDVVADLLEVARQDVDLLHAADAGCQVVFLDALAQGLDLLVGQGLAGDDDLEAVVVRRVVAAGEHHPGLALQHVGRVVQDRGGHHAHVADLATAVDQALDQLLDQFGAGQAAIAADSDARFAARQAFGADGAADPVGGLGGEGIADHAADVVGAEDAGGQWRGFRRAHDGGLLQSQEVLVFIENVDIQNVGVLEQRIDQWRFGGSDRGAGSGGSRDRLGGSCGRGGCAGTGCFGLAARLAGQRLEQQGEARQAQLRGFGSALPAEFLKILTEGQDILVQAAQQRRTGEVGAEDAAEQGQQRRECQQQRRGLGRGDAAGRVVQFPVRIAAVQRLRTLARRRPARVAAAPGPVRRRTAGPVAPGRHRPARAAGRAAAVAGRPPAAACLAGSGRRRAPALRCTAASAGRPCRLRRRRSGHFPPGAGYPGRRS